MVKGEGMIVPGRYGKGNSGEWPWRSKQSYKNPMTELLKKTFFFACLKRK
ncbi:MAG: hypothetical protein JEZ12_05280 [Desulfobacterium sp.]|nr:hypothetical protein [Desulfobacterium sp.]